MQEQHSFMKLSYTIIHHILHPIQVPPMLAPRPRPCLAPGPGCMEALACRASPRMPAAWLCTTSAAVGRHADKAPWQLKRGLCPCCRLLCSWCLLYAPPVDLQLTWTALQAAVYLAMTFPQRCACLSLANAVALTQVPRSPCAVSAQGAGSAAGWEVVHGFHGVVWHRYQG